MYTFDIKRQDTICALATGNQRSAIGVIRVSGPGALAVLAQIFRPKKGRQKSFVATLGDVMGDPNGKMQLIDEALCIAFQEGKGYTGEPSFELSIHGNPLLAREVLEALQGAGCRLAEPGEFTLRAFMNGKMDLVAAEGVADLIHAQSTQAAGAALRHLKGGLSAYVLPIRTGIVEVLAEIEVRLDFPDEPLAQADKKSILEHMESMIEKLASLLQNAMWGARLMEGARVVLCGPPNAGKSTLFNTLIKEERSIVHETPGTTRDALEGLWILDGIPVTLVDVAGLRLGPDIHAVEQLGIQRAVREIERADAILWLESAGEPMPDGAQKDWIFTLKIPRLEVLTKADLMGEALPHQTEKVFISAQTGLGMEFLKQRLKRLLVSQDACADGLVLTRLRHKEEVEHAYQGLCQAKEALMDLYPDEVLASELRAAGAALDRLLGKDLSADVLHLIFSRFCIGK